jgi:multimeric flavodoxin WrbA
MMQRDSARRVQDAPLPGIGSALRQRACRLFASSLRKTIAGCTGCNACFSTGRACSAKDDFDEIVPALENADGLALCTPLYWFSFPAQVKAVIDKLYSFYVGKRPLKIAETALLVCVGTDDMADFDGLLKTYNLIVKYQGWKDRG